MNPGLISGHSALAKEKDIKCSVFIIIDFLPFVRTMQMYGLIWLTDLRNQMDSVDLLIMLTSAVCHDLDHTGYNNAYQVPSRPKVSTYTSVCVCE